MLNDLKRIVNLNGLSVGFYSNGKPANIQKSNIMINLFSPSLAEVPISNIYLRVYRNKGFRVLPVFGNADTFSSTENVFLWEGTFESVNYSLRLFLSEEDCWFLSMDLLSQSKKEIFADIIYVQDTGLADAGMIKSNESYVSQYLDKAVFKDKRDGYVLCSRQNLQQDGPGEKKRNPWLMQGCLDKAVSFATDGFDLYTPQTRLSGRPEAIYGKGLPDKKRQFEFSLTGLQSKKKRLLKGKAASITFFSAYQDDHGQPSNEADLRLLTTVRDQYGKNRILLKDVKNFQPGVRDLSTVKNAEWFDSRILTEKEITRMIPAPWRNIEKNRKGVISFFHGEEVHAVCKMKDIMLDRPHGMICFSAGDLDIKENIISTTFWMQGVFQSQVSLGNVNLHRFLTINRNHLNCLRLSGQRIFIRKGDEWEQLGVPSLFEMGTDFSRWYYVNREREIRVTAWVMDNRPVACTEIEIVRGDSAEFLITNNYGEENGSPVESRNVEIDHGRGQARITVGTEEMSRKLYPELSFALIVNTPALVEKLGKDEFLFQDKLTRGLPVLTVKTGSIRKISILLTGTCTDKAEFQKSLVEFPENWPDFNGSRKTHLSNRAALLGGLKLSADKNREMAKLQEIIPWFFHCALVHYHVPHGLEQFGGAAWGVRDVCQGPVEMFLALGHDRAVKGILMKIFSHQFFQSGNWPQYFMFDRYNQLQNKESHGDVIVWPLYSLSLYCEQTGDLAILEETVEYTDYDSLELTEKKETVLDHVMKLVTHIRDNVIPGTSLSRYEEGDWDDTLQPAQDEFRARMASGWTVPLTYQSLKRMSSVLEKAGLKEKAAELGSLSEKIHDDFQKYFMSDGTVAGFIRMEPDGNVTKLLHPSDMVTGIRYRLLPMTRGVISGVYTPEQAKRHLKLVDQELLAPDGARLMDSPAPYSGGNSKIFRRAEQAANFGREIGLMYAHAHIRFVESLEVIGDRERAFDMLMKVNPILLKEIVPNALTRQSNAYFSSSDACFDNRYEAAKGYRKVYSGKVPVAGGWRVYSSGPGLWMGNLISGLMGIRRNFGDIVFDPILPAKCDGIRFEFEFKGLSLEYTYHTKGDASVISRMTVNGKDVSALNRKPNPYRSGGAGISFAEIEKMAVGKKVKIGIWR